MNTKRSFRKIPFWRKAEGPIASVLRVGERILIDFEYSPARVAAIKGLKGARYHPENKGWSVPRNQLEAVLAHKEFPKFRILLGVGSGVAVVDIPSMDREEALAQIRANPFAVSESAIASVALDLIVRINIQKRRLRIFVHLGSPADKLVRKTRGVTFSSMDSAFTIPSESFPQLLKSLRDNGIAFAVDAAAGEVLASSAKLRSEISESPDIHNGERLFEACLTPFITEVTNSPGEFRPCYFTAEQFKLAFPSAGKRSLQQAPYVLDRAALLAFIARRASLPFTVWITHGVAQEVASARERILNEVSGCEGPIDNAAADVISLPFMWRTSSTGRGLLAIGLPYSSEARTLVAQRIGEILGTTYDSEADALHIEVPDSRLLAVFAEVEHIAEINELGKITRTHGFERLLTDVRNRSRLRERINYYSALDDISAENIAGLELADARRLFPHQRVAIEWLKEFPCAFLGDDMGLGKTLSVLSYFNAARQTLGFKRLLVVCPNSLTRNWVREVTSWFPCLRATLLSGDKAEKAWTLRLLSEGSLDTDLIVVNYEAIRLPYVTPQLAQIASQHETILCLDESQRVKNHQAKTFKALSTIAPHCPRRVLLSGTPTPRDVSDLWAQMKLLDGGERFGKSFFKWLGTVAELGTEYSEFAVKRFIDAEVGEAVHRAQEIMLRRRKERVVNLPPKTFSLREIEMSGSQRERYDEIREGLILRMRTTSGEQFTREITNILEEYLRAVQVSSNPRLIDPEWKGEPAKFLELDEIVNEVVREQGQKIVVWTNYLGNIRELVERYRDLGAAPFSGEVSAADRERTVRAFQNEDSPRILVAVPAAGGVGITLTAAQTAVYIDKTWNAEHWMQSVDRIHRIGQTGTVNVISLLSSKVDEMIHWNLRRKEQGQAQVLGDYGESGVGAIGLPTRRELLEALEVD